LRISSGITTSRPDESFESRVESGERAAQAPRDAGLGEFTD